jgi:ubiquinone/menaquinone biosynthesis C-methylase UbiE
MAGTPTEQKQRVQSYWEETPCGTVDGFDVGEPEYFAEVEAKRYEAEPFIPAFAEFWRWRGKRVLEVGVGQGTDFLQFARAGAVMTGVDLTEAGIALTRKRLAAEGLEADLRRADAEALPFEDGRFDLVYSWGVLHHTPRTERAIAEVKRVIAPGGEARIMLYSRRSWTALGYWLRYALAKGQPGRPFTDVLSEHTESPGTKAYVQKELDELFADWSEVSFRRFVTPYDRRLGGPLADALGPRFGWFVGITARP